MGIAANLPPKYAYLSTEPGPRMLLEALKLYDTVEAPGRADNPTILGWARELGLSEYRHDETPWCGLAMGISAKHAGLQPAKIMLRALAWAEWGTPVVVPLLGDVLTFQREGGGHVGLYVAEDSTDYHVLGGNQSNRMSITRIIKSRLHAARRSPEGLLPNMRRVVLDAKGAPVRSTNEA